MIDINTNEPRRKAVRACRSRIKKPADAERYLPGLISVLIGSTFICNTAPFD